MGCPAIVPDTAFHCRAVTPDPKDELQLQECKCGGGACTAKVLGHSYDLRACPGTILEYKASA